MMQRRYQHGASLLEILVSLVILAIGVLGMSGLLTASLRSNQSAYLRTQATFHAQDIVERVRANQVGADAGHYNNPTPQLNSNCTSQAGCTAAQMAAHDVAEWQAAVSASQPSGAAVICIDSTPDDGTPGSPACDGLGANHAIKLWWDDDRDGSVELNHIMTFRP